jgi:hypothetical protein
MKINEILNEGSSTNSKKITLPVAVQVYNEEEDEMKTYTVPMTFNTIDVSLALSYLLTDNSTGDSGFGMGGISDASMAADALMRYSGDYTTKASNLYNKLGLDY